MKCSVLLFDIVIFTLAYLATGRNKSSRKHECNQIGLECAQMDNDHWRTEPKWHCKHSNTL